MDIRNKVGRINIGIESKEFSATISFDGVETEMTGLTPIEYIQILKSKAEISQLSKESVQNVINGIKEAVGSKPSGSSKLSSEEDIAEELLKHLPFLKGAKIVKVNPKDMSSNPFGPGGLFD